MSIIIIGAMMEPNNNPNLNQSLFGAERSLGVKKAKHKNRTETINDQ